MRKYDKYRDNLFSEILQHLSNGKAGAEMLFGRSEELMQAKEYLTSENNLPLIFYVSTKVHLKSVNTCKNLG